MDDDDPAQPTCPFTIARPVMLQRWATMTFLHWRYDADVVQRLLPDGLTVQQRDGSAWVGLLPFHMTIRPPGIPTLPWLWRFCETNVRTYVRDPEGHSAIWFFSLDAERLPAVSAALAGYGLPYRWSSMRMASRDDRVRYRCRRRWPGPADATNAVDVVVGQRYREDELSGLDHFLTARWALVAHHAGRFIRTRACHPQWPLHHARVTRLDDELVVAGGLPAPVGAPLVHFSPGVDVQIGAPEVLPRA